MAKNKTSALARSLSWTVRSSISSLVTVQTKVPDSQVIKSGTFVLRNGTAHIFQFVIPVHINISTTYLLTYLLTPWYRVLLEKLIGLQLVKKFPNFYGTRRFITSFTSVRHLSLSWASPIQSTYPHPTSWRSILILSTHLRLGLFSGLFPSGFPMKTLYAPVSSPIRATCPAYLILLDFITRTILGDEYRSLSSSLCNLLHSPVTFVYFQL